MQKNFGPLNTNQGSSPSDLAKREGILEEKERTLQEKQKLINEKYDQLENIRVDLIAKLEKVSSISKEEAKKLLLENLDSELVAEISRRVKEAENDIKLQSDEKAKEILADAMLHGV